MRFLQKNSRRSSSNRFIQHTAPKELTIVPPTMKGQFDDPEEEFETSIPMPFVHAPRLNHSVSQQIEHIDVLGRICLAVYISQNSLSFQLQIDN